MAEKFRNPSRFRVVCVYKKDGSIIGAELEEFETQKRFKVRKENFLQYKGYISNAIVAVDGKMMPYPKGYRFVEKTIIDDVSKKEAKDKIGDIKIKKLDSKKVYYLYYRLLKENKLIPVLKYDRNAIEIFNKSFLPFGLRFCTEITPKLVLDWMNQRFNAYIYYIDGLCKWKGIEKSFDSFVKDSWGVSRTDNFVIKNIYDTDIGILKYVDGSSLFGSLALMGHVERTSNVLEVTSVWTLQGRVPKCIKYDNIWKKAEIPNPEKRANQVAHYLNINVPKLKWEPYESHNEIERFTSLNISLVHEKELQQAFGCPKGKGVFTLIKRLNRKDIYYDYQKMIILNYILGNTGLSDTNYGLLYDSETFEIKGLTPCYGFSHAFDKDFNGLTGGLEDNQWIDIEKLAYSYIKSFPDIYEKLKTLFDEPKLQSLFKLEKSMVERVNSLITCFELVA